ncbi:DUF4337 family protein [Lacihabitans sp. LS3-19]|uniref:DUF4337 family protein n=1 Tax=Lacihabitans sp. LS3-19 TaxID=2487335 RepID=UPI0020CF8F98|nr:DUF4337 family protein [Lacihabitans sp. LS3-19]MCP9767387.1 DUF4337 family protein [Lacihabitans sp. LS3-19]
MFLEPKPDRFETTSGLIITIIASFLAFVQIMDDNFGAEELKAVNEKAGAFQWQQSKSIKQNLVEGQVGLIETLIKSKTIGKGDADLLEIDLEKLKKKVHRYELEKTEILKGSKAVGKDNWVQDVDGELGKVIGAKEWEEKITFYENKGDQMALSSMFLQISLMLGGLALILQEAKLKLFFFYATLVLGAIGISYGGFCLVV